MLATSGAAVGGVKHLAQGDKSSDDLSPFAATVRGVRGLQGEDAVEGRPVQGLDDRALLGLDHGGERLGDQHLLVRVGRRGLGCRPAVLILDCDLLHQAASPV